MLIIVHTDFWNQVDSCKWWFSYGCFSMTKHIHLNSVSLYFILILIYFVSRLVKTGVVMVNTSRSIFRFLIRVHDAQRWQADSRKCEPTWIATAALIVRAISNSCTSAPLSFCSFRYVCGSTKCTPKWVACMVAKLVGTPLVVCEQACGSINQRSTQPIVGMPSWSTIGGQPSWSP